jgi:hypothetical protein
MRNKEVVMEPTIKKTIASLEKRQMKGHAAANLEKARDMILGIVSSNAIVGIGDSSTVRQVGIIESLRARGNRVIDPFDKTKKITDLQSNFEHLFWPSLEATLGDVFLTGSHAITEDGRIVNVDAVGNRVAGMVWGHQVSIIIVGRNKIVDNLEEALDRVKNLVAPEHLRRKGGHSPCTVTGRCHDCSGAARACAVTTIIERQPMLTEIHVVIVNKDLGLSWDRSWPEDRINGITSLHERFMFAIPPGLEKIDKKELWRMARLKKRGIGWPSSEPAVEDQADALKG